VIDQPELESKFRQNKIKGHTLGIEALGDRETIMEALEKFQQPTGTPQL